MPDAPLSGLTTVLFDIDDTLWPYRGDPQAEAAAPLEGRAAR